MIFLIISSFFAILCGCASTPTLPYHVPVRAELANRASLKIALSNGIRLRGSQDDRATPLDKTPYKANADVLSLLVQKRLLPWSSFDLKMGPNRPFELGLSFLPYGSGGGDFRLLLGADIGMYFTPTTIEAKDVQGQPKKLRKGLLSGWIWNVTAALGYRLNSWWLISTGARRQAFNFYQDFSAGINEEWTVRGDQVVLFFDQGFDFGPWRLDLSVYRDGLRLDSQTRDNRLAFSLAAGIAW